MTTARTKPRYPVGNREAIQALAPKLSLASMEEWTGGRALTRFVQLETLSDEVEPLSWRTTRSTTSRVHAISIAGRAVDGVVVTFFGRDERQIEPPVGGKFPPTTWKPWDWNGYDDLRWLQASPARLELIAENSTLFKETCPSIIKVEAPDPEMLNPAIAEERTLLAAVALAHTIVPPQL